MEKCGFVFHILTVTLLILYLVWIWTSEESLEAWKSTYYPPKSWSILIPTSLVCLFLSVPIIYFACNAMAACPVDSMDGLTDACSRQPPASEQQESHSVPDIYDLDVATINDLLSATIDKAR